MAYWRTVVKGGLGTGEVWSCGFSWGIVGLAPDVPDEALAADIAQRLVTGTTAGAVPTSMRFLLSTAGSMASWRVEKRGENEKILSLGEAALTTPLIGTSTATKTPQDAIAISLRTSTPGARGRGRFYWPALANDLSTAWLLTNPTPAAVAADVKSYLNGLRSVINAAYAATADIRTVSLAVRSVTDHVSRDVNKIQVGNVLDTQRRRRDALNETYASQVFP